DDRQQLAECLSHDIELERLVNAESCPAVAPESGRLRVSGQGLPSMKSA
ncbi:hypothetical protein AK812_SmicGene45024, partial [Symbiodinium microadriaticum]